MEIHFPDAGWVLTNNSVAIGSTSWFQGNTSVFNSQTGLGGSDPTITIPSVGITQANGNALKTALATRSRTHSGMFANLGINASQFLGADPAGRMLLYAPNPIEPGSSVSHYDVTAFPNQLMEPAINGDLLHAVTTPNDLTFQLLKDIGWN